MSTAETLQTVTTSSNATEQLAERLASNLRGGEVIELVSDLGGGKTTFVRGLARGLGSTDHVSSPTFTISNVYNFVRVVVKGSTSHNRVVSSKNVRGRTFHIDRVVHYDFYRLGQDAGSMKHELEEAMQDDGAVIVVEWGQAVREVLPKVRLTVHIKNISENEREFSFDCPKSLKYLLEKTC